MRVGHSDRSRLRKFLAVIALLVIAAAAPAAVAQETAPGPAPGPEQRGAVEIADPPLVTLQASPPYGTAPLMVGFLLNAVDPANRGIVSFTWNFGDGHFSTEPPIYVYNLYDKPGNYVVTVTVTTPDGRSATGFTGVIVKPPMATGTQQGP